MADEPKEKFVYHKRTSEEQEKLAWDIIGGQVFGTWNIPKGSDPTFPFLVLTLMSVEERQELITEGVVACYEYISEAGPRSVNGMPCFFSVRFLNKEDCKAVFDKVQEIQEFRKSRIGGTDAPVSDH